jgi:hypothetical protein
MATFSIPAEAKAYEIVRFRQNGPTKVIESGVTLKAAQNHCSSEHTKDSRKPPSWFDGYRLLPTWLTIKERMEAGKPLTEKQRELLAAVAS